MLGAFLQKGDVISGAVLAALGVYIITQARAWDYYTLDGPGPGFFPFWYGVVMLVLSLLLIVNSARTGVGNQQVTDHLGLLLDRRVAAVGDHRHGHPFA